MPGRARWRGPSSAGNHRRSRKAPQKGFDTLRAVDSGQNLDHAVRRLRLALGECLGARAGPSHYEVCRVSADHQITTVWNYEDFPPLIANATGGDIDTPAGTLFYQFAIGSNVAEVRSLTERGFVRTAALGKILQIVADQPNIGLGWHAIAPC